MFQLDSLSNLSLNVPPESNVNLQINVEEFLLSGRPNSSAAMRVVVVHNIKEEESEKQQEVQEDKRNEEKENDVDGEVGERVTRRAHETWR